MKKEDLLKVLGFESCYICNTVFTQGGEMTCIDWARPGLETTTYHFCERHKPDFKCEVAIGSFGRFYKNGLKCFCWISGTTETSAYWTQIEESRVKNWLDKIYE